MSTTRYTVTKDAWVQVTSAAAGSLFVERGGEAALTEATALPTSSIINTPLLDILAPLKSKVYFSVPVGSYIYARALRDDLKITDTPAATA